MGRLRLNLRLLPRGRSAPRILLKRAKGRPVVLTHGRLNSCRFSTAFDEFQEFDQLSDRGFGSARDHIVGRLAQ